MKKIIVLCVFSLLIATIGINTYFSFKNSTVTKSQAIKIATNHVKDKYGEFFLEYEIAIYDKEKSWIISYSPPKKNDTYVLGGGGPIIEIKKSSGKILSSSLQK